MTNLAERIRRSLRLFTHGGWVTFKGKPRMLRPVWQMIALLPVWLIYAPSRWFVDLVDRH